MVALDLQLQYLIFQIKNMNLKKSIDMCNINSGKDEKSKYDKIGNTLVFCTSCCGTVFGLCKRLGTGTCKVYTTEG